MEKVLVLLNEDEQSKRGQYSLILPMEDISTGRPGPFASTLWRESAVLSKSFGGRIEPRVSGCAQRTHCRATVAPVSGTH